MGVVLVLEPDGAQAELLLKVLRKRVKAEAILVTSTASAIEVIGHSTPDLILLTAFLAPRDEDRLMEHLRSLEDASHLQTLTIPQLAIPGDEDGGMLRNPVGRFRKKKAATPARAGCDPDVFAQEVSTHLATARETRKHPAPRAVRRTPAPQPEIVPSPVVVEDFPAPDAVETDFVSVLFEDSGNQAATPAVNHSDAVNDSGSVFDFPGDEPVTAQPDYVVFEPEPEAAFVQETAAVSVIEPEIEPEIVPEAVPLIMSEIVSDAVPEMVPEPEIVPAIVSDVIPVTENDTVGHLDRLARRFGFRSTPPKPAEPAPPPAAPSTAMVLLAAFGDRPAPAQPRAVEVATENTVWLKPDITEIIIEETGRLKPDVREIAAAERRAAQAAAELEARLAAERRAAEVAAAEAEARLIAERRAAEAAAAEAEARLAAERRAARAAAAETEARLAMERRAAEVAAAEAEARLAAERRAAAETEARLAVERRAAQAAAAEAEARLAAERRAAEVAAAQAEARLAAEWQAAQTAAAETEARLAAQAAAETEARLAAERLAEQVAAEAEARLAAELERVRAEGDARRLSELARLEAEAEVEREKAIAETRTAAAREAREALASELTRVRSEAEGVFAADLARVRAEVQEKLSAQVEAAETRLVEAEQARTAAETAAAEALGAEVARVRGEAEARLQSEMDRIRAEADAARMAELSVAKHATRQIREAAAREAAEARANAEAAAQRTLEAEMARVRAQADRFLQTEIERVHADAQERQAAELQELRAEMAEIRDTAARTAAEQSVDYYKIWQPAVEAAAAAEAAPAKPKEKPKEEAEALAADDHDGPLEIDPGLLAERHLPWLKWAVPTAACMLFIANIGPSAKPAAAPTHAVEPVEKPFVEVKNTGSLKVTSTPVGARLLVDGKSYGQTPITIPDLEPGQHTLVLRTNGGSITRKVTIRAGQTAVASEAIFSGWVAIYAAVPMTVSLNGKPVTAGSDGRIMTPPGTYEVGLVNEQFNFHGSKTLEVRPGEVTAYTVPVPSASVHVVAPEGADIMVDGNPAGKAPLEQLSLPLGTHEVTATLPDGSKRGVTIAARSGAVTEARIEF